ncbi:MAG TPA: PAS domain S-box protein, partial [Anaerolineae bacterium]|nr:PAS domain S-box protein [Anaerolineae bacterium]
MTNDNLRMAHVQKTVREQKAQLTERIKELNCLYNMSQLREVPDISLEQFLQGTVELIPPAWQFPELTCARITVENHEYKTQNFQETAWRQASDLLFWGTPAGRVEVYYLKQRPESDEGPFLVEEQKLLNAIAERLGRTIERMRMEAALRVAEERYRAVSELTSDLAYAVRVEPDGTLVPEWVTEAFGQLTGFTLEELAAGDAWTRVIHREDLPASQQHIEILLTGRQHDDELRIINRDGQVRWLRVQGRPTWDEGQGRVVRIFGAAHDITYRKRAEEKLQWERAVDEALSTLYRPLISPRSSLAEIANTVLDQARTLTGSTHGYVSAIDPVTGDNVGYTLTEMLKGECAVSWPDRRVAFPLGSDGRYPGLWGYSLNDGESFFTNSPDAHPAARGLPPEHIQLQQFLSVPVMLGEELVGQVALANPGRDYTERDLEAIQRIGEFYALAIQRKRAQEALQESEEKYRNLVEDINDVIYELDAEGVVTYVSPAIESLLGYRVSDVVGQRFSRFILADDGQRAAEHWHQVGTQSMAGPTEYRAITKSGTTRWLRTSAQTTMVDGQAVGVRGVLTDVTEQVETGQQLRAALAEKETLLKEIHHRVKNNLQLISAMLALQARATGDKRIVAAFDESQHRILSMASIHEQLYRSSDLSQVDMGTYIRDLAADLQSSYGRPGITIQAEAANVLLDIDQAIPCGLIVNELVSNALKHAFPLTEDCVGE